MISKLVQKIKRVISLEKAESLHAPLGKKLNLGCGSNYRTEWDNWDLLGSVKAEAHLDFSKDKFPAEDNYYSEIYCNGVVEQILHNEGLLHLMNECHRVLKPCGVFTIVTPNANYPLAFRDPHTCKHFTPETFRYFCKGMKSHERYGEMYGYQSWSTFTHDTDRRGLMTIRLKK